MTGTAPDTPVLCFDLDGTLLDSAGRIHPEDLRLLRQKDPPALFIPTTGRPLEAVRRTLARQGLYAGRSLPLPAVLQNGAVIYDGQGQVVGSRCFEAEVQPALFALAEQFRSVTFLFLSALEIHLLWPHPFGVRAAESYDFTVQPFTPASREARFCKVMVLSPDNADLQRVAAAAAGWPVERAFSMPTILELTPLGVNKGTGLQLLLQALGRAEAPVYAAGDGENDLAVLEKARCAFVPHTAPEAIRAHATRIVIVGAEGLLTPMLRAAQADRSSLTGAGR